MPRQFMIRKSSPDKDIIKMHPIKSEEGTIIEQEEQVPIIDEESITSEATKPFDLSVKPKSPEVKRSLSPEEDLSSPTNKVPTPPVGVIEFCPKIVSSNTVPPIGVAMIDRNRVPSNHVLKPAASLESLHFRSSSDVGAITSWPRPLYPTAFLPYPIPFMPLPGPPADFVNASSVQCHHGSPWRGGLLGGAAISATSTLIPMSAPRIQIPTCFSPEANSFYDKPLQRLNQMELLKENSSYTNMWASKEDSMSPISRPDSCESNKEFPSNRFNPLVSSSTGSPPSAQPPRYFCSACNKSYATYSGLSRHKQFHCITLEKKAFNCKYCDKVYISLGALKMHIRTHTLPCKCTICGKAFSRPWLLQGHIRTHTGEKPFSCPHCSRSFADRSNLRAHLQTHSDVKKYSCNACSKTFSRMSLLMKHNDGGCGARTSAHFVPVRPMVIS